MKKNSLAIGISVILVLAVLAVPVIAAVLQNKTIEVSSGVSIFVDGDELVPKDISGNTVDAFIYNGTTYLPVRAITEATGGQIAWDGENMRVDITTEEHNAKPVVQNDLGGMSPEEALKYMQETENLVIVDVASKSNYERVHFENAINIPIEDLNSDEEDALYKEIPKDRPVILHCRQGVIVPGAYRRLKELRPDIPEISYIAGAPLFTEYNEWVAGK